MVAMLEQEVADEVFGLGQITVREQRSRRHYFGRQRLQCCDMRGCLSGVLSLPRHPEQAFEHAPVNRESRVHTHGVRKRVDRLRCLLQRDMAVTALLVQTAESRMQLLESGECRKRCREVTEHAL